MRRFEKPLIRQRDTKGLLEMIVHLKKELNQLNATSAVAMQQTFTSQIATIVSMQLKAAQLKHRVIFLKVKTKS